MSIAQSIDRALRTVESRTGNRVFTWKGEDIPCIPDNQADAYQIRPGGFEGNPGVRLLVRWALWKSADSTLVTIDSDQITADSADGDTAENSAKVTDESGGGVTNEGGGTIGYTDAKTGRVRPVAGKRLTFRGRDYRIDSAKLSTFGSHVVLELGDVNR
jgi:hypothetical protein